jgi:hypothetical protein
MDKDNLKLVLQLVQLVVIPLLLWIWKEFKQTFTEKVGEIAKAEVAAAMKDATAKYLELSRRIDRLDGKLNSIQQTLNPKTKSDPRVPLFKPGSTEPQG